MATDQADISLVRRGIINYTIMRGDSFAPPPVSFEYKAPEDAEYTDEDFSGADLTLTIRTADHKRKLIVLTQGAGIAVSGNVLEYAITADDMDAAGMVANLYRYDVQKDKDGIRSTIQAGALNILQEETYQS